MISSDKIRALASEHWGVDALTEYHWEKTVEFARLVEAEVNRIRTIENTRIGCLMNGGHEFALSAGAGFSELEYGSPMVVKGWTGTGNCQNCDAQLGVRYREEA